MDACGIGGDGMDNAERGALAEYLVACALGGGEGVRVNWDKYDLLSPEGIAVEVKSSGYNTHASLDIFCKKFSEHVSERYLIYTKDLRKDHDITLLPVFMTMFL